MENKEKIAKIVGILMMSRTYAHMAHLRTSSYSKHIALNDFYDDESDTDFDVTEMADDLAEAAQGIWGKLDIPFIPLKGDVEDPIDALETHIMMIENLSKSCKHPFIDNIIQEIQKLYYQTLYKLRELD
ncbi:MAG: DUF5856 family protein [Ignavibacteria bacterium]|jgi:hypothetical protein